MTVENDPRIWPRITNADQVTPGARYLVFGPRGENGGRAGFGADASLAPDGSTHLLGGDPSLVLAVAPVYLVHSRGARV